MLKILRNIMNVAFIRLEYWNIFNKINQTMTKIILHLLKIARLDPWRKKQNTAFALFKLLIVTPRIFLFKYWRNGLSFRVNLDDKSSLHAY